MMETTRKYTIGDAELVAEILEGEVLQLDEVGTTHVHGQGGADRFPMAQVICPTYASAHIHRGKQRFG